MWEFRQLESIYFKCQLVRREMRFFKDRKISGLNISEAKNILERLSRETIMLNRKLRTIRNEDLGLNWQKESQKTIRELQKLQADLELFFSDKQGDSIVKSPENVNILSLLLEMLNDFSIWIHPAICLSKMHDFSLKTIYGIESLWSHQTIDIKWLVNGESA
jgi:hypothetical protein